MKKSTTILLVIITFITFSCKQNAADKVKDENINIAKERDNRKVAGLPEMTFESTDFDFGTIKQGEKVTAVFTFTNTGESDLIITQAKASCGCTVPEWPQNKKIKPGESDQITAVFDSKSKRNKQNKSITLTTNTLKGKELVYVKGFVTPDPSLNKNAKPKTNIQ